MRNKSYIYELAQLKEEEKNINVDALIQFINKIQEVEISHEECFQHEHIEGKYRADRVEIINSFSDLDSIKKFAGFVAIQRIIEGSD